MHQLIATLSLLFGLVLLSACGFKGDLELPPQQASAPVQELSG